MIDSKPKQGINPAVRSDNDRQTRTHQRQRGCRPPASRRPCRTASLRSLLRRATSHEETRTLRTCGWHGTPLGSEGGVAPCHRQRRRKIFHIAAAGFLLISLLVLLVSQFCDMETMMGLGADVGGSMMGKRDSSSSSSDQGVFVKNKREQS